MNYGKTEKPQFKSTKLCVTFLQGAIKKKKTKLLYTKDYTTYISSQFFAFLFFRKIKGLKLRTVLIVLKMLVYSYLIN